MIYDFVPISTKKINMLRILKI